MTVSIRQFIEAHEVTLEVVSGREAEENGWPHRAWVVELHVGDRLMTIPYRTGMGIDGQPDIKYVLDALASDSAGYENAESFENWAEEYGFDTDSRKAEQTYLAVEEQAAQLLQLLGEEGYTQLLWEVERA